MCRCSFVVFGLFSTLNSFIFRTISLSLPLSLWLAFNLCVLRLPFPAFAKSYINKIRKKNTRTNTHTHFYIHACVCVCEVYNAAQLYINLSQCVAAARNCSASAPPPFFTPSFCSSCCYSCLLHSLFLFPCSILFPFPFSTVPLASVPRPPLAN